MSPGAAVPSDSRAGKTASQLVTLTLPVQGGMGPPRSSSVSQVALAVPLRPSWPQGWDWASPIRLHPSWGGKLGG